MASGGARVFDTRGKRLLLPPPPQSALQLIFLWYNDGISVDCAKLGV